MPLARWFSTVWNHLIGWLYVLVRRCNDLSWTPLVYNKDTKEKEKLGENLRRKIYCTENCDLHDILREKDVASWPDRQIKINESYRTIEITERFHKNLKKLELSSSITDYIRIIEENVLQIMPNNKSRKDVREALEKARQEDSPELVIKAYTYQQCFSHCLNNHLAENSHHFIKLYCTIQNCPILNQTQEYTEAFTTILTHPKLDRYVARNITLYRGAVLHDKKLIENYKAGDTILTTTLLSTSINRDVALVFCETPFQDSLPVLWIYNINDPHRRSAFNLETLSQFDNEVEILILRYVPFKITLVELDNDRITNIYLTECSEQVTPV